MDRFQVMARLSAVMRDVIEHMHRKLEVQVLQILSRSGKLLKEETIWDDEDMQIMRNLAGVDDSSPGTINKHRWSMAAYVLWKRLFIEVSSDTPPARMMAFRAGSLMEACSGTLINIRKAPKNAQVQLSLRPSPLTQQSTVSVGNN
jgi:hypothetical protein